jgi:hypothetical protein
MDSFYDGEIDDARCPYRDIRRRSGLAELLVTPKQLRRTQMESSHGMNFCLRASSCGSDEQGCNHIACKEIRAAADLGELSRSAGLFEEDSKSKTARSQAIRF